MQIGTVWHAECARARSITLLRSAPTTFVTITETGFTGDGDNLVQQVTASTQGFSLVLAGLKALLEHSVRLNLVADRYPKGLEAP